MFKEDNPDKDRETFISEDEIDLRRIFEVLARWRWLIALLTIMAVLTAGILSFFILPPIYEAQTTLLVVQGEKKVTRSEGDDLESIIGSMSRLPEMTIKTYVEQTKDPALLGQVIKKLDLTSQGYTVENLLNIVSATAIKDTNLIEVKAQSPDPQLAKSIAGTLTELLLESISKNSQDQMSKSVVFLEEQAGAVKKDLEEERAKLKALEARPRSTSFLEQERNRITQDLSKYQSTYLEAQISREQAQAALAEMNARLQEVPELIQGQTNPLYLSLKQQITEKKIIIVERDAQIKAVRGYMADMERQLNDLQVELTNKKEETETVQRKVDEYQKTYNLLSEKITQTQITKSANLGETSLQVVSPSTLKDSPVKPNKRLNIAIAGVLGILMSVILAFLLELLDNRIRDKEDVERHLGLPVLGVIPKFKNGGTGHAKDSFDTAK